MFNFKRKHRVPVDEALFKPLGTLYFNRADTFKTLGFYEWIEAEYGIKREFSWSKDMNFLIFKDEKEFAWFMLKL